MERSTQLDTAQLIRFLWQMSATMRIRIRPSIWKVNRFMKRIRYGDVELFKLETMCNQAAMYCFINKLYY